MGFAISLVVSGKIDAADRDSTGRRRFPDRALSGATVVFELARSPDVDGENLSCGGRHELASVQVRLTTGFRCGSRPIAPEQPIMPTTVPLFVGLNYFLYGVQASALDPKNRVRAIPAAPSR